MTVASDIPAATLEWLTAADNPAVAVLARRALLGESPDSPESAALWAARNTYAPVAAILDAQLPDGSWDKPARDYQKYRGSLWQIHFLGELWANPDDERVQRGIDYAFSRQMPDGSWSCNHRPAASIPCLTANVGRAIARLGHANDERIVHALESIVESHRERGPLVCTAGGSGYTINGYCHMLAPKLLLFLAEVPSDRWPDGAGDVRDAAIGALRDKEVFRCLAEGATEFMGLVYSAKKTETTAVRETWLAEHPNPAHVEKPGWKRFGFPLSYNSDALESLAALMAIGEPWRPEYEPALQLVESLADEQLRWTLRTSFNGKMFGNVERKGRPGKWLTLRALQVLAWFRAP